MFQNVLKAISKYKYHLAFLSIGLIHIFNLFIDVMDIDSAQYASIAREMAENNSFLEVYHRGNDYLDKPPLLFWLSAVVFKLLGVSNFGYKLPTFLLMMLGVYSVYRFSLLYYKRQTALAAVVILSSTQACFLMTNDVRTDGNLTALIAFTLWQLAAYLKYKQWRNLILGFIGLGLAMVAKGPIALITLGVALGSDFILKKQWQNFFKWEWLLGLAITALVLLPMSYGLYTQFDLHPEKSAYGIDSPSGLKFFYWTQSFGRITGESSWSNDAGFFFFFHSILWDSQPWALLLILGLAVSLGKLIRGKPLSEYMTLGGFGLMFIALSFSKYKLPHYIFGLFPFVAIIIARYLTYSLSNWVVKAQAVISFLFGLIIIFGLTLFFPPSNFILPIILAGLITASWFVFFSSYTAYSKVLWGTLATILAFNFMMSTHFFSTIIRDYQASSTVGKLVLEEKIPADQFYWYRIHEHSLDFYSQRINVSLSPADFPKLKSGTLIYTNKAGYEDLKTAGIDFTTRLILNDFPVTELNIEFLYAQTRPQTLEKVYLLEISK